MWLLLASPSGISPDTLTSFGVAAPIVVVLLALLWRSEKGRSDLEAARVQELRDILPVLRDVKETMAALVTAVDGLTEEQKRERYRRGEQ